MAAGSHLFASINEKQTRFPFSALFEVNDKGYLTYAKFDSRNALNTMLVPRLLLWLFFFDSFFLALMS